MEKQSVIREALIEKFEGKVDNRTLLEKYKDTFRDIADMYSQFRSYLFALAKTHPDAILELLKNTPEVVVKSVSRSLKFDDEKRRSVAKQIILGNRYEVVAQQHQLSVARTRGIFMEVVTELSQKHNLGIPGYFGKKQIIAEHKEKLLEALNKGDKKIPLKEAVAKEKRKQHGKIKKSSPKK